MEFSGQLYAPTALPYERNAVRIEIEAGFTQETVRTYWRREISFHYTRIQTPNLPARSLMNYTHRTVPFPYVFGLILTINSEQQFQTSHRAEHFSLRSLLLVSERNITFISK
jgi:hypothetical protein